MTTKLTIEHGDWNTSNASPMRQGETEEHRKHTRTEIHIHEPVTILPLGRMERDRLKQ